MRTILPVTLVALSIASAAIAADNAELARCAALKSDAERLACFDSIAKSLGIDAPKQATVGVGKWRVRKDTSPIDDKTNVYLNLDAETTIKGWPSKEYVPTLILRCKEGHSEAYVSTGMSPQVEYGDGAAARVRFDKERVSEVRMGKSTDGEALFFPEAIKTMKQMAQHEAMLFEFTPFNSSPTMTTFDLKGTTEAIKPLRETCRW